MKIIDLHIDEEYQEGLNEADIIRIPILPHYAGHYRLEYDGKYITLFGCDRNYEGFNYGEDDEVWHEEMVLISCVVEVRKAGPSIVSVDDKWISIALNLNNHEQAN